MSFSANSTSGNYNSNVLNCGSQAYGFRSNEGPTYYADRTIVRSPAIASVWEERNAKVSLVQPYITIYMWRRTGQIKCMSFASEDTSGEYYHTWGTNDGWAHHDTSTTIKGAWMEWKWTTKPTGGHNFYT